MIKYKYVVALNGEVLPKEFNSVQAAIDYVSSNEDCFELLFRYADGLRDIDNRLYEGDALNDVLIIYELNEDGTQTSCYWYPEITRINYPEDPEEPLEDMEWEFVSNY